MKEFSHYIDGSVKMVDITRKKPTHRVACAYGVIILHEKTLDMIEKKLVPKGDPFEVARIAGIMAAKKNSDIIPLCHNIHIDFVDVQMNLNKEISGVEIKSEVRLLGITGAEMEALTAVSVAALTIYDMCKAVDENIVIENIHLIEKHGGKTDFLKKNQEKK